MTPGSLPACCPEGFQNPGSCGGAVFVDESAEEVVAFDRCGGWWVTFAARFRRRERECSARAFAVVVGGAGAQHVFEVAAEDQQPVKTLASDGADEPLGGSGAA